MAPVARELGLGEQLLGRWVAQERARLEAPEEFAAAESEKSELERLRRENAQLRMDNEFLGKAAAFFASKQQKRNASS